jgi:hypothetical protein
VPKIHDPAKVLPFVPRGVPSSTADAKEMLCLRAEKKEVLFFGCEKVTPSSQVGGSLAYPGPRPSPFALCPSPFALCPLPFALCPLPFALCPVPCALCPLPFALFALALALLSHFTWSVTFCTLLAYRHKYCKSCSCVLYSAAAVAVATH